MKVLSGRRVVARCSVTKLLNAILSAILVGATILSIVLSFRFGIDRGHDVRIASTGIGHFWQSVCAVLSKEKFGTGRYVCSGNASRNMQAAGLGYDDGTLAGTGKTLPEFLKDTAFIDNALRTLFLLPSVPDDGGVTAIGWGQDAGYEDFVDLAFFLFGHRVESLYLTFFLLLAISAGIVCVQFSNRHYVLFSVFALQYVFWTSSSYLEAWGFGTVTNPRLLSMLAILPLLHALFLMVYEVRPSPSAVFLFVPQAVLMVAAGNFRATAYWAVIALGLCCALFAGIALWRRRATFRDVLGRCWPALVVFACLAGGMLLAVATTDGRLASIGGMRRHAFWQPLYYNLQLHPDWKKKYSEQHKGATGDATALVAVASYQQRHPDRIRGRDFVMRDKTLGLTQVGYEKYVRAAYIEFLLNDPRYVMELKYYNAMTIASTVAHSMSRAWASLRWPFVALAACVAVALVIQSRRKTEALSVLTWSTAALVACALLAAGPVWATVVVLDALFDTTILAILASFAVGVWGLVSIGVVVSGWAVALYRKSEWGQPRGREYR